MAKRKPKIDQEEQGQPDEKNLKRRRRYSVAEWFGFGDKPDPRWDKFSKKHSGNPALEHDAICALPEPLINALKLEITDFFSKQEEQFERDLAQVTSGGFFLRHPFSYSPLKGPLLDDGTDENFRKLAERQRKSDQQIKQMLVEDMEQHGRSAPRIEEHFATKDKIEEKIADRKWGYAGWLVTNPDFRKECIDFRNCWEHWIREIGGFPEYPTDFMGRSPVVPKAVRAFYDDYTQFYQRWCIHTFATWDLPIPMRAGIATPIFYPLSQVSEAGMALFIPWYLLRDQTFKLQNLAKHERFSRGPDHLQGWFRRDRNRWGHERLRTMLKVFYFVELCLKRRYPDQIDRRTEELDYALSRLLFQSPDPRAAPLREVESIRKVRQEMGRRLKSCLAAESSGQTSETGKGRKSEPDADPVGDADD